MTRRPRRDALSRRRSLWTRFRRRRRPWLAEAEPGTSITWALRRDTAERAYGGGQADDLAARGALGTRMHNLVDSGRVQLITGFGVTAIHTGTDGQLVVTGRSPTGAERTVVVDPVVSATGFRPDFSFTTELRLDLDPIMESTRALAPLIDPNEHSCGSVPPHGVVELSHPETGYYAVGMKSYGRAPTFLLATGYEQVRSIVAALAGDWTSAYNVELDLPETGVCCTDGEATQVATPASTTTPVGSIIPIGNLVPAGGRQLISVTEGPSSTCC